jgi:hypothetical protein
MFISSLVGLAIVPSRMKIIVWIYKCTNAVGSISADLPGYKTSGVAPTARTRGFKIRHRSSFGA